MSQYRNPVMKELTDQQVRYAPRDARLKQIERAESLLAEIDPRGNYPYRDICESITEYKPEMYPDLVLSGEEAVHDSSDIGWMEALFLQHHVTTLLKCSDDGRIGRRSADTIFFQCFHQACFTHPAR